jgi:hypothetical protein
MIPPNKWLGETWVLHVPNTEGVGPGRHCIPDPVRARWRALYLAARSDKGDPGTREDRRWFLIAYLITSSHDLEEVAASSGGRTKHTPVLKRWATRVIRGVAFAWRVLWTRGLED